MMYLIAGLGSIGRRHLRNLQALGQSDILLLRSHRSTLPDEDLAGLPVETDLSVALGRKPDAVIVSNPTAMHLDVAIPAAEAGCHILLEKPVSHSIERVEKLQEVVRKSGSRVLVGFHFRFHPGLRQAARLLSEGAIGRPLSFRAGWGDYLPGWHPWEDYRQGYSARSDMGGGVILTLCHPLDYVRWLLGEVEALWSFAGQLNRLEIDVEDTAEIGLRMESGALGSVHLDYNQRPSAHTLEIIGELGSLRWDNAEAAVSLYRAGEIPAKWKKYPALQEFERNHLFLAEMKHFIEIVEGKAEPVCTLEDGLRALQLALAARHSAQHEVLVRLGGEDWKR